MALLHWKTGAVGAYFDPANWVEGVPPGPGDTTIIADPSGPNFYPVGVNPSFSSSIGVSAPPGDTITGQTIDFTPTTASTTTPQLSNTLFAAGTTINVTGLGTQNILAWFQNTFQGAVNIGDAVNSGRLELTLLHQPTGLPAALAANAGVITIAGDSVFHISPFFFANAPGPFFDGLANFDNNGAIAVAPGGELVESQASIALGSGPIGSDVGPYSWTFNNNGLIGVQGGGNRTTLALLETNVAGNGSIVLDGGTSTDPVWTQLRITGTVGGGSFDLRDASIVIGDALGGTVNTGGAITFKDGNSFALLESPFDPFAMPITGFQAGDTIALAHGHSGFLDSTYSYNWDQPTHQLTIFETPTFLPTFELARLTLNGTYGANDFTLIDNTGLPTVPGAVSINSSGTFITPFQLDITTIDTPPPAPNIVSGTIGGDLIYGLSDHDPRLAYDEIFYGNGGADIIYAGGGNDWVWASASENSNVTFFGQDGNDVLVGFGGNDWLQGDAGNDTLISGVGNDTLLGGAGNDSLWGGAGDDNLQGGDGNDVLVGGLVGEPGNDWLFGNAGNDVLIGGNGINTLIGGDGDDQLWSSSAGDALNAGSGADLLVSTPATAGGATSIDPGLDAARDQVILESNGTKPQDILTSGQSAVQTSAGTDVIWNFSANADRLLVRAGDHTGALQSSFGSFPQFAGLSGTLLTNGGNPAVFLAAANMNAADLIASGALVLL
jgi:Ca2+-binding RTX toxin-like protein